MQQRGFYLLTGFGKEEAISFSFNGSSSGVVLQTEKQGGKVRYFVSFWFGLVCFGLIWFGFPGQGFSV